MMSWINLLLFPACVALAVLVVILLHRRNEARWRADAERLHHGPAE
jgi:hypothetical protein